MKKGVLFIFLLIFFGSCENETRKKQNCEYSAMNDEIHKVREENEQLSKEYYKLMGRLKECNDTNAINEIYDFNSYVVNPSLASIWNRQTDLILACGETDSKMIADTLRNIKNACEVSIVTNFIANGFNKLIESELNYYDGQLLYEDAYKHYGNGVNTDLKKYWIDNYSKKMTLGEVLILLKKIQGIIYNNNLTMQKNALAPCVSK